MYVCICARVRETELRQTIDDGADCAESVGDACGAGTGCGSCLDRICDLLEQARPALGADTLVAAAA
jgi:bacterioferritin-associated ferredoxin